MNDVARNEEVMVVNGCSSRKAIFAGVLAALALVLLLGLAGMSAGLSLFSPTKAVLYTLSIGAVLWLVFSTIASMYTGGWVASYFAPGKTCKNGVLNGFVVSAVSLFIVLGLTFSGIGSLISGSFSGLQYALSATKEGADSIVTVAKGVSKLSPALSEKAKKAIPSLKPITDKINQKIAEILPEEAEGTDSVKKIKADLEKLMLNYLNSIENPDNEEIKEKLVSSLTKATGKSSEEINQKLDEWKNDYLEAKEKVYQKVAEVSKDAAKAVAKFALLNFFILILGIVAGIMGGVQGIRRNDNCE